MYTYANGNPFVPQHHLAVAAGHRLAAIERSGPARIVLAVAAVAAVLWAAREVWRLHAGMRQQRRRIHGLKLRSLAFNREHLAGQQRELQRREREYCTIGDLPAAIAATRRTIRDLERDERRWR